jgi:hypothetical protein
MPVKSPGFFFPPWLRGVRLSFIPELFPFFCEDDAPNALAFFYPLWLLLPLLLLCGLGLPRGKMRGSFAFFVEWIWRI